MNNAEKFKQIFGLYATELWSMPESDFLEWLNRAAETAQKEACPVCGYKLAFAVRCNGVGGNEVMYEQT